MSRKASMASTYVTEKRISQWEELMRKFSEAHREECKTVSLDIPKAPRSVKYFPTGSQYEGTWDVLGMSGGGEYTFPNGVTYEGDFEDGMFNGKGELRYDSGAVIRGKWKKGVMTDRTLLFSDSLEYNEEFWKYCRMPDRRFAIEYDIDLMPAGKSFLTADQPTKEIPPGYYDTGDGFYDPKTKVIYKYTDLTAILRAPSVYEQKWIIDNCRTCPEVPLGPRQDLYEKWSEPMLHLPPTPAPAAGVRSQVTTFRQQSIFEQDYDYYDDEDTHDHKTFYDFARSVTTDGRCYDRSLINIKFQPDTFKEPPEITNEEYRMKSSTQQFSSLLYRDHSTLNAQSKKDPTRSSRVTLNLSNRGVSSGDSVDLGLNPQRNQE